MDINKDTNKAIHNIMKWTERPEWAERQDQVFDEHFLPALEELDIELDEFNEVMIENNYMPMLYGLAFEDFISRPLPPDGTSAIDEYLLRRGWRESVIGKRYLQQLSTSVLSLYEVVAVSPGEHCDIRDLVRGGKPVRVHEVLATQSLFKWDHFAARVVTLQGKAMFSGGILPISKDLSEHLLDELAESEREMRDSFAEDAIEQSGNLKDEVLRVACPDVSSLWIIDTWLKLHSSLPDFVNENGEEMVLTETRFPVKRRNLAEIEKRINEAYEWDADYSEQPAWMWFPEQADSVDLDQIDEQEEYSGAFNGSLVLNPDTLVLITLSVNRMKLGIERLSALLKDLIGPPLSSMQTPQQAMADTEATLQNEQADFDSGIDPETEQAIINQTMDKHYRNCLNEPIPMLDGKTPRECIRTKAGKDKVRDWLKYLENTELHAKKSQGQQPYDFGWMWDELGLR